MIVSDTYDHSISTKMNTHPLVMALEMNTKLCEHIPNKHDLALDELITKDSPLVSHRELN